MIFTRATVSTDVSWSGLGLHSGESVTVTVHPGQKGILFRHDHTTVEAVPSNVTDTSRCTRLGEISTIEHLMSALAIAGVTDAEVEVTGRELPALDGASETYFRDLRSVGLEVVGQTSAEGLFARVYEKGDQHEVAIGQGAGWWRYTFVSDLAWIGVQDFETHLTHEAYGVEIAPARTFGFERELEHIRAAGLAQGLNEHNAFVLGESGFVNPAKFPDEPARHKLLDLIGDLYLAGIPPQLLNVVAERSGHTANVKAAAKLRAALKFESA